MMQSNMNNLKPNQAQVKKFLRDRMGAVDAGFMVIWCAKGKDGPKRSKFFGPDDSDKAALYCADMIKKGWDVYFGQGILKNPLQSGKRGSTEYVVSILGFWFDGDLKGGIHSEDSKKLPTAEELETFFRDEIPFRPTQVIASSPDGGRHLHWLFNEPFYIRSEDDRTFIKTLSTRFQQVIIKKMKAHKWNQDNTADLVRVLRIPGTFNFKGDPPVPVAMVEETGFRYKVDAIVEWVSLEEEPQQAPSTGGHKTVHRNLEAVFNSCAFMGHWRDAAADLTEPEWWCGCCAICQEDVAEKIIHEISSKYPSYSQQETQKKIAEAQKLSGPMTCKGIREKTGFEGCPLGGCGVVCPVHLGGGRVEWETPILLDDYQVPMFDVELPGVLGEMVAATSVATETPLELAAGDCLAAVATTIHGKAIVRIKPGYSEPLNIWTVIFLEPGNRKSSVLMIVSEPITSWEAAKREEMAPMIRQLESERKNQEARLKSLRGRYGKAKRDELSEIEAEILAIENELMEVPVYPKVWCQDVTPEHLGTLLGRHEGRMAILSAEGGIFDIIGGRYNGGIPNLDLFLQGHSGDSVRVDRGSRDSVYIAQPALTFGLSPQPDVLRSIAEQKGFRGRGLLARFLYFLPKSNLGHRTLETEPIPEGVSNRWEGLIHALLDIEPQKDPTGQVAPFVIDLSRAAYNEWFEFQKMVEPGMAEGGRFESMKDWAGKLPGAAARLAGLLHCVKCPQQPWAEKISAETMGTALDLAAVFASHAETAFDLMGAEKAIAGGKKLWRWVERGRFESFTKRDCFQALRGTFPRVSDLKPPLDVLEERNYLSSFTHNTGGRPSVIYTINPALTARWT